MSSSPGCSNPPCGRAGIATAPKPGQGPSAVKPYGLWPSPIDAEQVAHQATAYDAVHASGEAIYWLETRPSEAGRAVVVRWIGR